MLGVRRRAILRVFPHRQHNNRRVYNIQVATIVNDVAMIFPQINAVVENQQANHQALVVEIEGKLTNRPVSILVDLGSNLSYISPQIVEACVLQKEKHKKTWMVQLATRTKRKVTEVIKVCQI